ncbi:acyl carrier protein [Streptomyces kanamyceticus]|uniref:Acyl carrier protein n=1 Tax=Streptomyces kanamyceticus TaxID=1967 RepID=A0A5J6G5F2_STRKN|nr:acyl carrier protein [Streptomyces kanamyceticus]QEU90193.1 acyl carrier protein [Streptomyces kanamyceticus]
MTSLHPSARSLEEQISSLLETRFGVDAATAAPDVTFSAIELDSLALVELSDVLQELFDVPIADDDLGAEQTIGEAAALIRAKLNEPERIGKKA